MNGLDTKGLIMFSTTQCPGCVQSAHHMNQFGIPFREVKVDGNMQLITMLAEMTKQRTVPQFFFDGKHLTNGFQDVLRLHNEGVL